MIDDLIKIFKEGGYPLLAFVCSLAANVAQFRERQKTQAALLNVNKQQHEAQLKTVEILTRVDTKTDKCPR